MLKQTLKVAYFPIFFILIATPTTLAAEQEWKPVILNVPIGGVTEVTSFAHYFQI